MSRERHFFVADLDAPKIVLGPDEAHHLVRVLRLREGAEVFLFDGRGRAARARVLGLEGDSVTLGAVSPEPSRESFLSLAIGVAPPKGDRMSLIVQKLTELGVVRVVPLVTERGELDRERCQRNMERWRRVALEACKQCGRSLVPEILTPQAIEEVADLPVDRTFIAEPGAEPLTAIPETSGELLVLIGPEGGWSEKERAVALAHGLTRFGLGPRTLRTETVAIAAASVLQFLAGDLKI